MRLAAVVFALAACDGPQATPPHAQPLDAATEADVVNVSSVPADPIQYPKNDVFTVDSGTTNYVFVPSAYDDTHQTPITLFVWLHGCGGFASGDIWSIS